ncbi:MAG: VWA domain-containing protein [Blastocatellales bacterium]
MAIVTFSRIATAVFFTCLIISDPSEAKLAGQQSAQPAAQSQRQQNQQQSQRQPQQDQESVVRITTQLVQVDAIVTDKKGKHIEDLSEEDFELTVDGKRQQLTHFKLVRLVEPKRAEPGVSKEKVPALTSMPTRQIEAEKVRRTIALVVDDLGLSFSSVAFAKDALKRFVAEQMQEGDLVGIIRTSSGFGIYQQFTSDKRILYAAIDKLRFALNGRRQVPFTTGFSDSLAGRNEPFKTKSEKWHEERNSRRRLDGPTRNEEEQGDAEAREAREARERDKSAAVKESADREFESFRESIFAYGTLGALNYVVRALRPLPGRKVAVVLSDGLPINVDLNANLQRANSLQNRLLNLIELANRSSVAFYSVNVEGTVSPFNDPAVESIDNATVDSFSGVGAFNDGLRSLAYETGGLALYNNNNTDLLVNKAVDDNRSYYLVGFDPEDETFDRKRHKIKLAVKRPGLQVRTRAGFFGIEDSKAREIPRTREAQLLSALFSPFGAKDIPYQVTSLFFSSTKGEPVIRSYFHIDCSKLKFKDEENGEKSLTLELANFTFNENGAAIESYARSFTLRFDEARYRRAMAEGLTYLNDFPVKKPGAYQFRSALRDAGSGLLGSSNQFIQIPDLKKDRILLSGIILNSVARNEAPNAAVSGRQNGDVLDARIQPNPAARRFASDSEIEYQAAIYNPKLDKQTGKPDVKLRFELYRDGKPVFQSPERPARAGRQTDTGSPAWLDCGGRFQLKNFSAGEYYLRLVIKDELREGKYSTVEQWIDFSVR